MRRLSLVALTLLAGCSNLVRVDVGGQQFVAENPELKQDLQGRRVVDMTGMQRAGLFEIWSPEIEERITLGGQKVASGLCGGPAELATLSRNLGPRSAELRYRCL